MMWSKSSGLEAFFFVSLAQDFSNSVLEGRCPAEFISNPDQTHLSKLTNVFRIIRQSQVSVFDQGWS